MKWGRRSEAVSDTPSLVVGVPAVELYASPVLVIVCEEMSADPPEVREAVYSEEQGEL